MAAVETYDVIRATFFTKMHAKIQIPILEQLYRTTELHGETIYTECSISNIRGVWLLFIITMFYTAKIPAFDANSVYLDQTPLSRLHCLPMSLLWNARNKRVNYEIYI